MMTNQMISDSFPEMDEDNINNCIVDRDKMLDDSDPTHAQLKHHLYDVKTHTEYTFPPSEGQVTLKKLEIKMPNIYHF